MSLVPAAECLIDFGSGDRQVGRQAGPSAKTPARGSDDGGGASDDAYDRGFAEGRAKQKDESEALLVQMRAVHQEQLETERRSWVQSFAKDIEHALKSGLQDMEVEIGGMTARVLKPFLSAALRRQAVQELAATLGPLLSARSGISLHVHGPADLLELLRTEMGGRLDAASFHPGDATDLRIEFGKMTLETQLAAWAAKLDEALE